VAILTSDNYPDVRTAIDAAMVAAELPDAVIESPVYLTAADLELKALLPDWESYTDDPEESHLLNAAILLTASYLALAIPAVMSSSVGKGDHSYRVERPSPTELSALLRARALAFVDLLNETATADAIPTMFTLASAPACRTVGGGALGWLPVR